MERPVVAQRRLEEEGLEEPRRVRPVPFGRADVGHGLHRLVLGRQREDSFSVISAEAWRSRRRRGGWVAVISAGHGTSLGTSWASTGTLRGLSFVLRCAEPCGAKPRTSPRTHAGHARPGCHARTPPTSFPVVAPLSRGLAANLPGSNAAPVSGHDPFAYDPFASVVPGAPAPGVDGRAGAGAWGLHSVAGTGRRPGRIRAGGSGPNMLVSANMLSCPIWWPSSPSRTGGGC